MIKGISGCGTAPFGVDTTLTAQSRDPGWQHHHEGLRDADHQQSRQLFGDGEEQCSNTPTTVNVSLANATAVGAPALNAYDVVAVVPNPFNPATSIRFSLPNELEVTAEIYAIDGSRVVTLLRGVRLPAGVNDVGWNGRNDSGGRVASGVYLFRLTTTLGARTARLVLLE
jgi:hypothetical protein